MELQTGLNELVQEKVRKRIQRGSMNASEAVSRLIEEGNMSNDFIAHLGANGERKSEINFSANGKVKMILPEKVGDSSEFAIHNNAVGQLGDRFGIPTRYIKSLSEGNEWERQLAAHVLNEHSGWTGRKRALVRSVGSEIRGVMSDSYRRLNSVAMITSFLQAANNMGGELAEGTMTDTRIYCEVLMPTTISIPTEKNGTVEMAFGARLSTSDYGDGALELRAFMMQGVCLNGMVRESVMRTIHLGKRLPDNLMLTNNTYELETKTTASAIRDLTNGIFSKDAVRARAYEIQGAAGMIVDMDSELKKLKKGKLLQEEVKAVETVLMRNNPEDGVQGESTLWKLVQGITAHGRSLEPRRERDLQEIAGDLMNRVKQ